MTGANPELPPAKELQGAGIQNFDSGEEIPCKVSAQEQSTAEQIDSLLSKLGNVEAGNNPQPPTPLVTVGSALPNSWLSKC